MDLQSLWQVLQPYLAGQLRHVLTFFAGYLVAKGALSTDQQSAFVSIGFTLAIWAAGVIWSVIQKRDLRDVPWLWAEKARLEKLLAIYQKQAAGQPGVAAKAQALTPAGAKQ